LAEAEAVELCLDTAGPVASVAVARCGVLLAELTWRTRAGHEVELLPAIDAALQRAGVEREAIAAIFVDRGPGGYAGLRVGASVAMGIALALDAALLGVGRLDLDAYPHAAFAGPVCALHQAGRGDIAWAVYEGEGDARRELSAPRLDSLEEFIALAPRASLLCGELEGLEDALRGVAGARLVTGVASLRRAGALAELGWQRYAAGARDDPRRLEPLYLREPSITRSRQAQAAEQAHRAGNEARG
jgi:tRNA threonylcarbamoyladenosine biosynthesis protein TsaB